MYNNKDLSSMGFTHTQLHRKPSSGARVDAGRGRLALVHENLVTCTKRTPKPLQALSTVYPMNSGAEKEPHEETNPHSKPTRREGRKISVFPYTIASSSAPLHRRICICNVDEATTPHNASYIAMKLHQRMLSSLSSQNFH